MAEPPSTPATAKRVPGWLKRVAVLVGVLAVAEVLLLRLAAA